MRVCQISVFMGRKQRRRAQINADIINYQQNNLRLSVYSASSASSDIKLAHLPRIIVTDVFY